jgi:hypothetical protein
MAFPQGSEHLTLAQDKAIKSKQMDFKRIVTSFDVAVEGALEEILGMPVFSLIPSLQSQSQSLVCGLI